MTHTKITDELYRRTVHLREVERLTWREIGAALGVKGDTVHGWYDPEFRRARTYRVRKAISFKAISPAEDVRFKREAAERMRRIPPDTRTDIQRLLGDPPPGRSALDQRRAARA